jgi:hypothetical protein
MHGALVLAARCSRGVARAAWPLSLVTGALALWLGHTSADAADVEQVMNEQLAANREAAAVQGRVNQLSDETKEMLAKYRQALTDIQSFERYNEQIEAQVTSQNNEIAHIQAQLDDIEVTARDVLPLMKKMVDTLEQFVALDVPFLQEERSKRVKTLKDMMPRADVTMSEKYRRILEAYEIEMEYGRTLEAYDGKLGDGRTVEFVRFGRVALLYRTSDGQETGYWDADKKSFVKDNAYAQAMREALRVAKKQGAPDMLLVPVAAPKKVAP